MEFGKDKLELVGFASSHQDSGETVYGSAAEINTVPVLRAYFELLERVSTLDVFAQRQPYVTLSKTSEFSHEDLFPVSDEPQKWKYSLSNGVASYTRLRGAAFRAGLELMERDLLLRSWEGELPPQGLSEITVESVARNFLEREYHLEAFLISSRFETKKKIQVIIAVGYPKNKSVPLLYGFGAGLRVSRALEHAFREMVQRFGFLLGESIPEEMPEFSPTPDFHQEYFLLPQNHIKLKNWLSTTESISASTECPPEMEWLDLTPPHLKNRLFVVRAVGKKGIQPLYFGTRDKKVSYPFRKDLGENLVFHPFT